MLIYSELLTYLTLDPHVHYATQLLKRKLEVLSIFEAFKAKYLTLLGD